MLIIDSDIGSDPDDTVTLAILLLMCIKRQFFNPTILWITSDEQYYMKTGVNQQQVVTGIRAEYTEYLLSSFGHDLSDRFTVIPGVPLGNSNFMCHDELASLNLAKRVLPVDSKEVEEKVNRNFDNLRDLISEYFDPTQKLVYVSIGALSNLARVQEMLTKDEKSKLSVYVMGGNINHVDKVEYNLRLDPVGAAKVILNPEFAGKLRLVSADTTFNPELAFKNDSLVIQEIIRWNEKLGASLIRHLDAFQYPNSFMHDPLTFVTAIQLELPHLWKEHYGGEHLNHFVSFMPVPLKITSKGQLYEDDESIPVYASRSKSNAADFMRWIVDFFSNSVL